MATTIADVARRAGVSTATVSRVLSGVGRASPATHARVKAAARDLGFRPSDVARSLKRRSTLTFGLIVTDIENPYFPQLVRAIEDAARSLGYTVLLCNAADDPERETAYLELLADRRVDGLIIASSSLGVRHRDWLSSPPVPVVLVNTAAPDAGLPTIMSDNEGGGRIATEHLLALGHRRFGYLMPPPRNVDAPLRVAGVERALRDAGIAAEALTIARGEPLVPGGETATDEILDRAPATTAFMAYNDLMAIGALRALRRRGLSVPASASVVGFDDVALAAYVDPPLTTVSQRTDEMARWAVEQLIGDGALTDDQVASSICLPVDLQVRGSSGPAPAG